MNVTNTPLYIFQNNLPYAFSEKKFSPAFKRSTNKDTFEKTTDKIVQTKYGTIHYHDGKFLYFDFNRPKNLNDALKAIKYVQKKYTLSTFGVATYDYNYKDYQKAFSKKFGDMKFTRYLGSGNTAMAIENEDGTTSTMFELTSFYATETEKDGSTTYYTNHYGPDTAYSYASNYLSLGASGTNFFMLYNTNYAFGFWTMVYLAQTGYIYDYVTTSWNLSADAGTLTYNVDLRYSSNIHYAVTVTMSGLGEDNMPQEAKDLIAQTAGV